VSSGDGSYAAALAGRVSGAGRRFGVVASRFNAHITEALLQSAVQCLTEHGAATEAVEIYRVPGAWELPQACGRLARAGHHDALLALGCLIRGETAHLELIAGEVARGLGAVALETGIPVVFGVLTTETEAQAIERADPAGGDKGREVALAALEMAELYGRLNAG
jgi:6,7-dimethyl-8-ribityllumazine synthase